MTTTELYAVYCRAFADYDPGLTVDAQALIAASTPIERAIVAFAVEDAENGTPLRSPQAFQRALETGAAALGPLGLRAA